MKFPNVIKIKEMYEISAKNEIEDITNGLFNDSKFKKFLNADGKTYEDGLKEMIDHSKSFIYQIKDEVQNQSTVHTLSTLKLLTSPFYTLFLH
jgi:hypothetical protein